MKHVQQDLMRLISPATILVGHSLDCDLKALKLIHMNVIDTAALFPHPKGVPFKLSLKSLALEYLQKEIQGDKGCHVLSVQIESYSLI